MSKQEGWERYQMLVEALRTGADLPPVDLEFIKEYEDNPLVQIPSLKEM